MVFTKVPELKVSFLEFLDRNKEEIGDDVHKMMTDWFVENTKKTRVKKEKEEKDPNRVKKSLPPSWLWKADNKEKIKEEHFGGENTKGSLISKKAKDIWDNELSDDEKAPYIEKYKVQMAKYREANPPKTAKKEKKEFNFNAEEERVVGDDWDGPHEDKLLWKYAAGRSIGEGRFDTFEKAVEAANKLPECGGITMGKNGYTLRKGNDPITDDKDDKNGPFVSWTKKDFTMPKKENMKKKKKEKKVEEVAEKVEDESKEVGEKVEAETSTDDEGEAEVVSEKVDGEAEISTNDESIVGSPQATEYDAETEDESDEESDEESDDEDAQVQVKSWTYKGKSYLVDGNDIVYDAETEDEVGVRVSSKKSDDGWRLKKN